MADNSDPRPKPGRRMIGGRPPDEEWAPERMRKVRKSKGGGVSPGPEGRRRDKDKGGQREKGAKDGSDDERISHPVLAAVFAAWERASVDFCTANGASSSSQAQDDRAATRAESVCDSLLAPLHLHLSNISRAHAQRERLKNQLYQVSLAKKAARAELMLADQELFHIRNLAEQEREDFKAAESERQLLETAHELVTDIEALLHRPSACRPGGVLEGAGLEAESAVALGGGGGGPVGDGTGAGVGALEEGEHLALGGAAWEIRAHGHAARVGNADLVGVETDEVKQAGGSEGCGRAKEEGAGRDAGAEGSRTSGEVGSSVANLEAALRAAVSACSVPAVLRAHNAKLRQQLRLLQHKAP